jgi:hypothetical protein
MLLSFDYSRVIAALEDRILFLVEKFKSRVPEASIRFLSTCDPSGGKYLEYLVSQRAKGIVIDRDDDSNCWAIKHALEFYMMVTQSKKVKEHLQEIFPVSNIPNDISQIKFNNLYRKAVTYYDDVKTEIDRFKAVKKHSKIIYQDDTYKIIVFTWDPSMNWDDLVAEVCAYGKGKWCTQQKGPAEEYLESAGGLYIVFKNGTSLLQTDRKEFRDVTNHNFNFHDYPDLAIILMKTGIIKLSKKTSSNWNPNKKLLDDLSYYHEFMSAPVRQYLRENEFI